MQISKHQPDSEDMIHVPNCVRLLNMGLQDNIVTIWAITDPNNKELPTMSMSIKSDNDTVTTENVTHYISSFINDDGVWHLFGEEPQVINPKGKILI